LIRKNIAGRYARGFFQAADEENMFQERYGELAVFSDMIKENKDFREFLINPVFSRDDKKSVIEALIKKSGVGGLTANLLKLLVDKRRIDLIPEILDSYREMMDKKMGVLRVTVKTALPLSKALSDTLKEELEKKTKSTVEMSVSEDPSLLGGVLVRVGNTYYDGSVKAQLNNIRDLLGKEI
jgi:F-type H+-transporting ATPase subunit delta